VEVQVLSGARKINSVRARGETADTLRLERSAERHGGSTPLGPTKLIGDVLELVDKEVLKTSAFGRGSSNLPIPTMVVFCRL
jgi:hypothetical protein